MKLGQCIDIDDMTSPNKFGKVTRPSSHFVSLSVFYRPAFTPFYRLYCKIANIQNIDLNSIDHPEKVSEVCEVSMSKSSISRKQAI